MFLHESRFCPTKRLIPETISNIDPSDNNREREILSIITHRVNLPNSWRHISLEKVKEQSQKDERGNDYREQAIETGKTSEYVNFVESYVSELEQKLSAANPRESPCK